MPPREVRQSRAAAVGEPQFLDEGTLRLFRSSRSAAISPSGPPRTSTSGAEFFEDVFVRVAASIRRRARDQLPHVERDHLRDRVRFERRVNSSALTPGLRRAGRQRGREPNR